MLQSHYCFCWGQRFHWFSTRTLASLPLCTQSTKLQQNVCILGKILCHVNGLSEYAGWFLVIQKFPTVMHHSEVCAVAQISQCSQRSFTDYNVCRVLRWLCQASAGESRHALGAPLWWWLVLARPGARITLDCRTGGSEEESGLQGSIMRRGQPDPHLLPCTQLWSGKSQEVQSHIRECLRLWVLPEGSDQLWAIMGPCQIRFIHSDPWLKETVGILFWSVERILMSITLL